MNVPKIISVLEYLDDDLLDEAITGQHKVVPFRLQRPSFLRTWSRLSVVAACVLCVLCLSGCAVFALYQLELLPMEETFIINYEESDANYSNEGVWSETDAFDVHGYFVSDENKGVKPNVDISKILALKKGDSKTWSLDIDGGWFGVAQDTVMVEIINKSELKFRYICEDVTDKKELANFSSVEGQKRILSNLNPEHKYEITIINLGAVPLNLDVKITSHHSDNGEIILE